MARTAILMALGLVLAGMGVTHAQPGKTSPDAVIVQVKDQAELQQKFCGANPAVEHVLVIPAMQFVDSEQLVCSNGPYKLYRIVSHTDTDDFEYFLDPPIYARGARLACDGKAGKTMQIVALNCRPLK